MVNKKIKTLFVLLLLLGSISQVSASEMYVSVKSAVVVLENNKSINLFSGTPVEVKKKNGKEARVVVTGFQFSGKLYADKGKKLLIATLHKDHKSNVGSIKKVAFTGSVPKAHLVADFSGVWDEQEEFFFEVCTQCHAAPNVKHHSMIEWEALLGTMKGFAKIDSEETASLLRYLQFNASDGLLKETSRH